MFGFFSRHAQEQAFAAEQKLRRYYAIKGKTFKCGPWVWTIR